MTPDQTASVLYPSLAGEVCPPCQVACPVHTNVRGYVAAIARGDFEEAYALARGPNPLVYVCAHVCAHPCEDVCRRSNVDEPVAIAALKRFATEQHDLSLGHGPPKPDVEPKDQKVAIIGAGPAGLTAAHDLARMGYQVTIFEALPRPGGMMAVGIPDYRLPKDMLCTEIEAIRDLGVETELNTCIGRDLTLDDLWKRGYKAIFLAVGTHQSRRLGIPGEELSGVRHGLSFLKDVNLGKRVEVGRRVAIIGGGDVAIDAARTARRLGAEEAIIVYRRSRKEMPAREEEVEEAEREGVEIHFLTSPTRILGRDGKVTGMECIRMKLGAPDASGRRRPIPVEGSEFTMDVDMVIPAIGQASDLSFLPNGFDLAPGGRLKVDPVSLTTSVPGVFAGGDVVSGPASVIEAIAAGKRPAISIDMYLKGEDLATLRSEEWLEIGELSQATIDKIERWERQQVPILPVDKWLVGFSEVELGFTEGMAVREAQRCLTCGAGATVDPNKCTACLTCVRVCPYEVPTIEDRVAQINITQCQACGICASECPAKAITLKLYKEEEIIAQIERLLTATPLSNPELTLLGFCCRYGAYADGESAEAVRAQLPPNVKVVELLCTGKLDVTYLLRAFELGADGVFVVGCPEGDCHNKSGSFWARKRVEYVKGLLDEMGLGGERLEMYNVSSDSWGKVAELATEMTERIRELGPNPLKKGADR